MKAKRPESGKFFSYIYETGDSELEAVAREAVLKYYDKNALDFTIFREAIDFERGVVKFAKGLMNAPDSAVGTLTSGGTESVFLAVKYARELFKKKSSKKPEMVVSVTVHPAFYKAAEYFDFDVKRVPIDSGGKLDLKKFKEALGERTALVVASAPNWPYGTVDPVEEMAEIVGGEIPLHVDSCLGGFILPFFERLGEDVPKFDFRVEGVTSISLDAHKYGYAPKGSSVILFRDRELKKQTLFVDVSSPGYIFVNQGLLSSRSLGPIAAAYSVIEYLGEEGYIRLAGKVLSAREKILKGLSELGFSSVVPVESSVLCLSRAEGVVGFVKGMRERGWQIPIQRGLAEYSIPNNVHFTISPIHDETAEQLISDAGEVLSSGEMVRDEEFIAQLDLEKLMEDVKRGELDTTVLPIILNVIPEEMAVEMIGEVVIDWFNQ